MLQDSIVSMHNPGLKDNKTNSRLYCNGQIDNETDCGQPSGFLLTRDWLTLPLKKGDRTFAVMTKEDAKAACALMQRYLPYEFNTNRRLMDCPPHVIRYPMPGLGFVELASAEEYYAMNVKLHEWYPTGEAEDSVSGPASALTGSVESVATTGSASASVSSVSTGSTKRKLESQQGGREAKRAKLHF
jgi:hypothetical protein